MEERSMNSDNWNIFPDQESAGINIPARLDNLYFQILLLSTFIYSGK